MGAALLLGVRIHCISHRKKCQIIYLPSGSEGRYQKNGTRPASHLEELRMGMAGCRVPRPWAGRAGVGQHHPCSIWNWLSRYVASYTARGGQSLGPTPSDCRAIDLGVFYPFVWLHPGHMKVPRLEVKFELQLLAYATAQAMQI